jgi:fumarate hydratase subunit beta
VTTLNQDRTDQPSPALKGPVVIATPLDPTSISRLRAGDRVLIRGTVYTGRDAAHRRLAELLQEGKDLPFDLRGQVIYYTGPAPARPGSVIGPAGPTTAFRMDPFTVPLLKAGLKGMIGKGDRSPEITAAIRETGAIYFAATGGAAVLLARSIKKSEIAAYPELGPEAVLKLEVEDLPALVAVDSHGGDLYREGRERYRNGGNR